MANRKAGGRRSVCGSSEADSSEYSTSILGKYMHPSCRHQRVREATKNHVGFNEWLEKLHTEIEATERKTLCVEAELNIPTDFLGKLSAEKLIQVVTAAKGSEKCRSLLAEYGTRAQVYAGE